MATSIKLKLFSTFLLLLSNRLTTVLAAPQPFLLFGSSGLFGRWGSGWSNNGSSSIGSGSTPSVSNLTVDETDPLFTNVGSFFQGWGLFNLGTEVNQVIFTLYNKANNYSEQVIKPESLQTLRESTWDVDQKSIFVIHGYAESRADSPLSSSKKVVRGYSKAKRAENVVFVDWHALSRQVNYFNSVLNTEKVGLYLAQLIVMLRKDEYIKSLKDVHVIGFSLGAHVAGKAAFSAGKFLNEAVGRLTGLDPAGPGFRDLPVEKRLDPGDAAFVDVIHTNMGSHLVNFGINLECGHVDFYPNGGEHQPGCNLGFLGEPVGNSELSIGFQKLWVGNANDSILGVCSHNRAPEIYRRTILGAKYMACPCSDYKTYLSGECNCGDAAVRMGEFVDPNARGKYYLTIPADGK